MILSDTDKRKLRDAFSVKASVNGNVMNFIGLEAVRDRFPNLWSHNRDRIIATSKAILEQFTDPRVDIILPVGDANFVVMFTRLGKDEAMLRAATIKAEILRRFVGDDALAALDVETTAIDIDSGSITKGVLRDLLGAAARSEPEAPSKDDILKEQQKRVYRASMGVLGEAGALSLDAIEKRFGFDVDALEFAFQPYFYLKRGVFSIFECRAVRSNATGEILSGYGVLPRGCTADQITAVDQMTLMRARHGLVDMAVRKRVAVVVAPVSFETMTTRATATDYVGLLQKIPSDLRNYLVIDVCRAPAGVPEGRLAEILNPLKRLTRAVFVRVDSPKQQLGAIKGAGAFGVGFALPTKSADEMSGTIFLGRFATMARKLGLQSYVADVDSHQQADRCREAGFDYLSGRALAELTDYVGPVREVQAA